MRPPFSDLETPIEIDSQYRSMEHYSTGIFQEKRYLFACNSRGNRWALACKHLDPCALLSAGTRPGRRSELCRRSERDPYRDRRNGPDPFPLFLYQWGRPYSHPCAGERDLPRGNLPGRSRFLAGRAGRSGLSGVAVRSPQSLAMKVGEAWQGRGKVLRVSAPPRASGQMAEKQKGGARSPPAKGRQIK